MDIRLLYENEIQMAVQLAQEVFDRCVRPYIRSQEEAVQFGEYVCVENLQEEMRAGRLFLWGAFENGRICAVAGMQSAGHITMLYVSPQYGRRKIGTQLLQRMGQYAGEVLHRTYVTVNVMPMAAASYFYQRGFVRVENVPQSDIYVPLQCRTADMQQARFETVYKTRPVSPKRIVALVTGALLLSFAIIFGVTVHHMVTEGTQTEYEMKEEGAEEI